MPSGKLWNLSLWSILLRLLFASVGEWASQVPAWKLWEVCKGPSSSCWWPDAVASAAVLFHLAMSRPNSVWYALQSTIRHGENVTWNTILEILPGALALRSVMGLSWVQCKIVFFFFKQQIFCCGWTKYIWRWLERTDVWSIFTFLWEEMSRSYFLTEISQCNFSILFFIPSCEQFLEMIRFIIESSSPWLHEWLLVAVNSSRHGSHTLPQQLALTKEELLCLMCLLIPWFQITLLLLWIYLFFYPSLLSLFLAFQNVHFPFLKYLYEKKFF